MKRPLWLRSGDLRGAARLVVDATAGLTDLVEAMHARIASLPGLRATPADERARGVSGLVYRQVRGATRAVGAGVDSLLQAVASTLEAGTGPSPDADPASPERDALVAALNGVLGDHLERTGNPLAVAMSMRVDGRTLPLGRDALAAVLPHAGDTVLLLLHGLCMSDRQWRRDGQDHGALLARALGCTPVHLRYNSGLHVSVNGRLLAHRLERLFEHWPVPVTRVMLLGHSMGGLVARSAAHYGAQAGHRWVGRLRDLVFLGTPHHGAPLERAGNWIDAALGATPYAAPFARLGRLRSAGITDLRHGSLLDEDWSGHDRFALGADRRRHLPLPEGVRCFAAAACLAARDGPLAQRLIGDGLVPLDSALGRHPDRARVLAFAPQRRWIGYGMGHLALLGRAEVAEQLLRWLR